MEDLRAVMHAAGSRRAVLFGYSEGAPMSILFAATNPGRVTALILGSASARWFPAPGYPCGQGTEEMFAALGDIAAHRWGQGASIEWYMPSRAGSARARELFGRFERMAINPSAFLRMMRMIRDIDVRAGAARDPRAHAGDPAPRRPDHAALPRPVPGFAHRGRPVFRAAGRSFAAVRREREHRGAIRRARRLPRSGLAPPRTRSRAGHDPAGRVHGRSGGPWSGGTGGG